MRPRKQVEADSDVNDMRAKAREYERKYYHKHKDKLQAKRKVERPLRRRRVVAWVLAYLEAHPCVDCGEPDPLRLSFDHVRDEKRFDVSTAAANGWAVETIAEEIAKCDVRCHNCHMAKTAKERRTTMWQLLQEKHSGVV